MANVTPSTKDLQSNCDIDIITQYYDEKGNSISNSSINIAKKLGFDVDAKFKSTKELVMIIEANTYNPIKISIEDICLIKESLLTLRNPNPEVAAELAKKVLKLPVQATDRLDQSWFTTTRKTLKDVEIIFPNGETHSIPVRQLKLKMFSDFVPSDYYSITSVIKYISGHEITYFASNDFIKIGCNKVHFNVVLSYLEKIERECALLKECIELSNLPKD